MTNRRAIEKLDLLFLAIESIDIHASQAMSSASRNNVYLAGFFPNQVELWKYRCHNPMRKSTRNQNMSEDSFQALLSLLSTMADRFYPEIRELLSTRAPENIQYSRWKSFSSRFNDLIIERMNTRRGAVKKYLKKANASNLFYKQLIFSLALSSGPRGADRLNSFIYEPLNYNQ